MTTPTSLRTPSSVSSVSQVSQDDDGNQIAQMLDDTHLPAPQHSDGGVISSKHARPKLADRFSRMFSQPGKSLNKEVEAVKDAAPGNVDSKTPSPHNSIPTTNGYSGGTLPKHPKPGAQGDKKVEGDKKHSMFNSIKD